MPAPIAVDELQVICQPHYNEPDQIVPVLIPSIGGLIDKAVGGTNDSNVTFSHDIYPRKRGGLDVIAFDDAQYGYTKNSRIRNENQTWIFTSKLDVIADLGDGILSYGNEYTAGTFMYQPGDSSGRGQIAFNGITAGGVGFLGFKRGDRFPLYGRSGQNHGGAVIYIDSGVRKWIWMRFDMTDENGNSSAEPYFKIVNANGHLRVNDDGEYMGAWSLPFKTYAAGGWDRYVREMALSGDLTGNMTEFPFVEITQNGRKARGFTQSASTKISMGADKDFNVYSIELDRELYLLNVYVNGVHTVQQAFNKENLLENQRIALFSDLSLSMSSMGQFGELLVLPYINQDARRSIESYLSNKWSVPVSNAVTAAPNFDGPPPPKGRYDLTNYYPEVIEDKPSNDAVFVRNEGIVENTPSGGIWLSPSSSSLLPRLPLPTDAGWSQGDGGVLWEHTPSKTVIYWRIATRSDMVFRYAAMQYSSAVISKDKDNINYWKTGAVLIGAFNPNQDTAERALQLSGLPIGEPEYQRFLSVNWATDPYDTSTITHKISGFNDQRDGFYARVNNELGAYLWLEHDAVSYNGSVYPTYQLFDGTFLDKYKYYGAMGTSQPIENNLVDTGELFYRYKKIANIDCSIPDQDVYVYCVLEGMDSDPVNLTRNLVFSDRLGKRSGDNVTIPTHDIDLINDGTAINLGTGVTTEEASSVVCQTRAPQMSLIRLEDEDGTFSYNTSIVNGDLLLEETSGDHNRKTFNGNMCIISQKYQSGSEPESLDDNGIRGFYNRYNDYVEYHKRELGDYQFEGKVRRLVSAPRPVIEMRAGIRVDDPLDVDAFIISDDVSLVSAQLDYEYTTRQSIDINVDIMNYNGSVTLDQAGLRMVTSMGHCYKRNHIFNDWEFVEKLSLGLTFNTVFGGELGYFRGSGAKISEDGTHILLSNKSNGSENLVQVRYWDEDDNIDVIANIASPYPDNDNFSSYFGRGNAISRDGKYVCTGTNYTSGVEGTEAFEGMFHVWEKNNSGVYVQATTIPSRLRGQDFEIYGLGNTNNFDSCAFNRGGNALILSNASIRSETKIIPGLGLRDGNWSHVGSQVSYNWGFGNGVQMAGDAHGSFLSGNHSIAKFDHTLGDNDVFVTVGSVGPSSGFPLGRWRQSSDGRVAVQSGYNMKGYDESYSPRPIEIRVYNWLGTSGNPQTPLQEIRTIKNNYYYRSNNNRITRTGDYTFAGPMTLGGICRIGHYSELYIFAENKLHVMQENVSSLKSNPS